MTINPIVAPRLDGGKDAWSGVWIAEDIELLAQGVHNGSWIDTTLGAVGATLDGLALISDPVGVLLQYGASWIMEQVKPLSEALDWLAGDPAQIAANAQTWRNIAASLKTSGTGLDSAVRTDLAGSTGAGATAYQGWASEQRGAIDGLAKAADAMALLTEGAGFLIAAVRTLVRDAIATLVSRLIVYAIEEGASMGFATPLVVEQVVTLIASWAAKISRWLRALISSLRQLVPVVRRLGELIDELKKILARLRDRGGSPIKRSPGGESRKELLDELARQGFKHNPDDIVKIGRDSTGKIVFLENGNTRAGLQHIKDAHASDFANAGVPEGKIADLVFTAVTEGAVVGAQRTRPIYEVMFEGKLYRLAVSVGDNGFIVGANPVGR